MTEPETRAEAGPPATPSGSASVVFFVAAIVGASAWLLPEVDGADLWWHMAAGRLALSEGSIPVRDVFTFTEYGSPLMNHEWLWGVLAWSAYAAHPDLLAWLNLAVATAVFAFVAWRSQQLSGSWAAACVATWLAAAASHWYIDVRPHLVTLLFTAGVLATFRFRFAPYTWPVLMVLWVNLHAGFLFGAGLIGLEVLVRSVVAWRAGDAFPWREWACVAATLLAIGINPWGFELVLLPFEHIRSTTPFLELLEWAPLEWSLDPASYAGRFAWLGIASLGGFLALRRDPTALLLVLLTAAMAAQARRFVPLFAVVAAPVAAVGFAQFGRVLSSRVALPKWAALVGSIALLMVGLSFWIGVRFVPQPLWRWTLYDATPTGAVAFLAAMDDPPERIFNQYEWGGFLSLFAPRTRIFIDGRASTLYSDQVALDYRVIEGALPGYRELMDHYGIDAILVRRPSPLANALARQDPPWLRIGVDPRSILMVEPDREVPTVESLLGDSADVHLANAFRHRVRRELDGVDAEVAAVLQREPLQIHAHGEAMMAAAMRRDADGIAAWVDRAVSAYPRRRDLIASFAERAWRELGDFEAAAQALESMRLGGPFVTQETLDDIDRRIALARERARGGRPSRP